MKWKDKEAGGRRGGGEEELALSLAPKFLPPIRSSSSDLLSPASCPLLTND